MHCKESLRLPMSGRLKRLEYRVDGWEVGRHHLFSALKVRNHTAQLLVIYRHTDIQAHSGLISRSQCPTELPTT